MNGDPLALVVGTLLAVGALAFVLYPLFFDVRQSRPAKRSARRADDDSAVRALREIEFDRATGKLSDADYAELRRTYGDRAVQEMRASAGQAPAKAPDADAIEARVRAYRESHRECKDCGLRPEPDAIYCSNCGCYLSGKCDACGSAVGETSAGFCSSCGTLLAAV